MDSILTEKKCSTCGLPKVENSGNFQFDKRRNTFSARCRVCQNKVTKQKQAEKRLDPAYRALENAKVQARRAKDRDAYNKWQREHYAIWTQSQEWVADKNFRQRRNYVIRIEKRPELRDYLSARNLEDYHRRKNDPIYRLKVLARTHKRRDLIDQSAEHYTAEDVILQLKSQKSLCWWCSKKLTDRYEVDHRIPISRGGHNGASNIVITHVRCNRSKSDKMPWEWNGRLL